MNKIELNFCKKKIENPDYHNEITLKRITKPITLLLGPNGTGKSMSIRSIKYELEKLGKKYLEFTTSRDDIVQKGAPAFGSWDINKLACAFHSEGERICDSFYDWAVEVMLKELHEDKGEMYIFIDEADSGLSFDRLLEVLYPIVHIATDYEKRGRKVYFIFSVNSYEMYEILSKGPTEALWIPSRRPVKFKDYKEFRNKYVEYYEEMHREEMEK